MNDQQGHEMDDGRITVALKDGSIVRINSAAHRENPNGNGLLIDVDYDILKVGSLPEDQVFDAMWAEVSPTFFRVLSRDPEVRAGVEARLKARRDKEEAVDPAAAPPRKGPRP